MDPGSDLTQRRNSYSALPASPTRTHPPSLQPPLVLLAQIWDLMPLSIYLAMDFPYYPNL